MNMREQDLEAAQEAFESSEHYFCGENPSDRIANWNVWKDAWQAALSAQAQPTMSQFASKADYEAAIKAQPTQEPARTKLIPMPTEESPRQWYFDCDGLYIDVEHLNGVVSIFVKHRGDNSVGWKELAEQSQAQEPESKWISVEDRLPEIGEEVIVFKPKSERQKVTALARRIRYEEDPEYYWESAFTRGNMARKGSVTHWMPLPLPPAPEGEKT